MKSTICSTCSCVPSPIPLLVVLLCRIGRSFLLLVLLVCTSISSPFTYSYLLQTTTATKGIHYPTSIVVASPSCTSLHLNHHYRHRQRQYNHHQQIMSLRPSKRKEQIDGTNTNNNKSESSLSTSTASVISTTSLTNPFYQSSIIYIITNMIGFIITLIQPKLHYHVDLLGTGAFTIATIVPLFIQLQAYNTINPRILISSIAVTIWSTKLASFLVYRVLKLGHDQRLTTILSVPSSAFGFWFISMLWGIICSVPHTMGLLVPNIKGTSSTIYSGSIIYCIGLFIETIADVQKWIFKQNHTRNEYCNVGVWTISQHPNWFGNLLIWIGIFIINSSTYIDPLFTTAMSKSHTNIIRQCISRLSRSRRFFLALCGPIFMYVLFYSQATGVILMDTIQSNYKKYGYGTNVEYTKYINETPLLIPNVPKMIVQWIRQQ